MCIKFIHRRDAENTEFSVGAEQERDAKSGMGTLTPPNDHHRDMENAEFSVGAEQERGAKSGMGTLALRGIHHRATENTEVIRDLPDQSQNQISGMTGKGEVCH